MAVIHQLRETLKNFLSLLTLTSTTIAEFQSSTTFLLLGLFLAMPWGELNPSVPYHAELLTIMPETAWVAAFLCLGVAQSVANIGRHSFWRMAMAFVAATSWTYLSILGMLVHPPSLFAPAFVGMALVQALCFLVMSRARFRISLLPALTDSAAWDRRHAGGLRG